MFVRLLHAAVALSLGSEPAVAPDAADAPDAPETSAGPADEPTTPESDAPAADAPADETPPADADAPDSAASETPAAETPAAETPAAETPVAETPRADAPAADTPAAAEGATPPPVATEAPRPVRGPPPSGRDNDIVRKALVGGGVASLTLTAGLIGASAWAWTEHNRAKRAVPNLMDQARVDAQDRQSQMRTIGAVTTAAAALYGTTGVVLLLLHARDGKQPPRTVLAPNPGGLSLVGRF